MAIHSMSQLPILGTEQEPLVNSLPSGGHPSVRPAHSSLSIRLGGPSRLTGAITLLFFSSSTYVQFRNLYSPVQCSNWTTERWLFSEMVHGNQTEVICVTDRFVRSPGVSICPFAFISAFRRFCLAPATLSWGIVPKAMWEVLKRERDVIQKAIGTRTFLW